MTELRELFEKITEEIICPVCLNLLHAPVTVCENGHGTCPDCRAKITLCSVCNKSFQNIKVRPLDDILSIIPRKCKFEGCEELVRVTDDHEELCGYRATACQTCAWTGCVKDIVDHVQTEFKPSGILREKNIRENITFGTCSTKRDTRVISASDLEVVIPLLAYEQMFWLRFTLDLEAEELRMSITSVPVKKMENLFKINFSIVNELKIFKVSSTMTLKDLSSNQVNFFSLSRKTIKCFVDSNNQLKYNLFIKKAPVPE